MTFGRIGHIAPVDHTDAAKRFLLLAIGHTQAFFSPQAMDALVVDPPARRARRRRRATPAPTWPADRKGAQESPQRELVVGGDRWWETLRGTGLADDQTGPAFGDPEPFFEHNDGSATTVRGQKFPRLTSFNMSMSRA